MTANVGADTAVDLWGWVAVGTGVVMPTGGSTKPW